MSSPQAKVDFACLECNQPVLFDILTLRQNEGQVACSHCHRAFCFNDAGFITKLAKLDRLLQTVKECEDILGDVSVGVATFNGEVKVPYRILLTRLNTVITLDVGGRKVDFHFRVEPLAGGVFR